MYIFFFVGLLVVSIDGAYGPHHPRHGHQSHHHHHHHNGVDENVKVTEDEDLLQDKEHMREDLKDSAPDIDTDKLTPEQLDFYYFKVHDIDNNTKLDGLEILNAVQHTGHSAHENKYQQLEHLGQIIELIDQVLEEDDFDKDGYLSYVEYIQGRNREAANRKRKNYGKSSN